MLSITMATLWLPYPGFLTARKIEFPVQFNRGFRVVSAECRRRDLGVAAGTILQRLALEAAVALWGFLGTGQHLQFPLQLEVGLPLLSQLHIFHVKHHGQQSHLWSLQKRKTLHVIRIHFFFQFTERVKISFQLYSGHVLHY